MGKLSRLRVERPRTDQELARAANQATQVLHRQRVAGIDVLAPKVPAADPVVKKFFTDLLTDAGQRFLAGSHTVDLIGYLLVTRRYPLNEFECFSVFCMGVDLVRGFDKSEIAIQMLCMGPLPDRFKQAGFIAPTSSDTPESPPQSSPAS